MNEFLDAVFRRRFQFGIPANIEATVSVRTALMPCWQPNCGAKTRILTGVEVSFGPHECVLTVPELAKHPEVLRIVLNQLSDDPSYSANLSPSPESRECIGCGRGFGQYFEQEAHFNQDKAHVFPIRLSQSWCDAIASRIPLRVWSAYLASEDGQTVGTPTLQL
jgi:competence protein CoiA